ncbi:MAG TPA: phosphocholine cytidylyltransferase family protein [Jatrophihabitans sp.]|jgi:choline kinase|uniref:phosphocholine cytidylyltransferase family protein n=1 Tax=Jatrophihabitans sp. TaxID=1932789 RepID=UPI002EE8775E
MKVVVPAAGLGERLRPYTEQRPKCLVEIAGVPIIERLLAQLCDLEVELVVCVLGYRSEMVVDFVTALSRRPPVAFVLNQSYRTSNSIVSLQASFEHWTHGLAVVDSDILVAPRLLRMLLGSESDAMVIDRERTPEEIDMAVELRDGRVWHLDKQLPPDRVSGEFFGLSHWTADGAAAFRAVIEDMIAQGQTDVWYQFAIRRLAKLRTIRPLCARRDEWTEIDTPHDLKVADAAQLAGAPWGWR